MNLSCKAVPRGDWFGSICLDQSLRGCRDKIRGSRNLNKMKTTIFLLIASFAATSVSYGFDSGDHRKRLQEAELVLHSAMATRRDQAIPQGLLDHAQCAVIVPGVKHGAFILGARYGKGYISCRAKSGIGWTAPGTIRI